MCLCVGEWFLKRLKSINKRAIGVVFFKGWGLGESTKSVEMVEMKGVGPLL